MRHNPTRRQLCRPSCAAMLAALATSRSASSGAAREYRRGGVMYRRLGNTDMDVSLLSFGSHTDPADRVKAGKGKTVLTAAGQSKRDRIVAKAFDRGINLIDVYESEGQWKPAAESVSSRRNKVLVSLAHEVSVKDIDEACRLFGHVDLYRFHTAAIKDKTLEDWDTLRKAKEARLGRSALRRTSSGRCLKRCSSWKAWTSSTFLTTSFTPGPTTASSCPRQWRTWVSSR